MLARFIAARAATMAVIVNRAVERGEVPPGTRRRRSDPDRDGQVYYWLFTTGEPLGQDVADRAAAIVAARAGVLAAELPGLRGDDPGDPAELRYTPTAHRDLGFQGHAGMAAGAR